jgi:iron complex transport system substrate-binding protein
LPVREGAFMAAFVRSFSLALLVGLFLFNAGTGFAAPKRIVSTSLCGDAYVWALIAPQNILSLSWQADSALSAAPKTLRSPHLGIARVERLAALAPDLVVMGPGDPPRAARAAGQAGASIFTLNWSENLDGVYENLNALGKASGRAAEAQQVVRSLQARLDRLAQRKNKRPLRVLYLTPNGTSAAEGVFVDQAILAAGGINHGRALGIKGWGRVPLEKLLLDPPDLILTSFFYEGYASVNNLRSRHPLMQKILNTVPVGNISAKNWVCAGPLLVDAIEEIANAMDALAVGGGS